MEFNNRLFTWGRKNGMGIKNIYYICIANCKGNSIARNKEIEPVTNHRNWRPETNNQQPNKREEN
jgi:hypothetical protein